MPERVLEAHLDIPGKEVYVLNKKYYRTSRRQAKANWQYVNEGFDTEIVPVTVRDWRVSPDDAHLNKKATEQVMIDLANRLRSRISAFVPFCYSSSSGAALHCATAPGHRSMSPRNRDVLSDGLLLRS